MSSGTSLRCIAASLLTFAALLAGCMDGAPDPHQNDRGAPCYEHQDCRTSLLCLVVPPIEFPVCTGTAMEGEACSSADACAWIRDDSGLPLTCVDATCHFRLDGALR